MTQQAVTDGGGKMSYDDVRTALVYRDQKEKEQNQLIASREEYIKQQKKAEEKEKRRLQRQQRATL